MNVIHVLLLAWSAGLVLERRGGDLVVNGADRANVHPDLLRLLREHKPELLAVLADRTQPDRTHSQGIAS